jgi:transposase
MRFYDRPHRFYAGLDLHARTLHLCILDSAGTIVLDVNLPCRPDACRAAIAPFRAALIVGAECLFGWYWLSDLCHKEKIAFLIGPALYLKAIHGGKAKNDRLDAHKIARLLKGGNFPLAYVYPKGMRETRDLLRRHTFFVRQRSGLFTHWQILNSQYNLPPFSKKLAFAANRSELDVAQRRERPQRAAQRRRQPGRHRLP